MRKYLYEKVNLGFLNFGKVKFLMILVTQVPVGVPVKSPFNFNLTIVPVGPLIVILK